MKRSWETRRYEIKYLIRQSQHHDLRERFLKYMEADPHANPNTNGYFNHSIYFDSNHFQFYLEKHEGMQHRIKPRLRAYRLAMDAPPSSLYLELKSRTDRVVFKEREKITAAVADELMDIGPLEYSPIFQESQSLSKFYYLYKRFGLRPSVAVIYHREALKSSIYPGLRITFDTRLQSSRNLDLNAGPSAFRYSLPPALSILEVKFNRKVPSIVLEDIRKFSLTQSTFSKFAVCVQANSEARTNYLRSYGT